MKDKHEYCIYAIVAGNRAFVGKTESDDYRAIINRHKRGEIKSTRKYFRRRKAVELRFVPLEHIKADSSWAYRYEIAYIRMFLDEGYEVLNSSGMMTHARDIHVVTQSVLDKIKLIPLKMRFWSAEQKNIQDAEPSVDSVKEVTYDTGLLEEHEKATEKLTVRLTPTRMKKFVNLAMKKGLSQSQLLMVLFDDYEAKSGTEVDQGRLDQVSRIVIPLKERNKKLETENEMLRQQIKELKKSEKERLHKREVEFLKNLSAFMHQFTSLLPDSPPLEQGILRKEFEGIPASEMYRYPKTEENFNFYPEKVMLGRGKYAPLFILGHDEYNQRIMIRFYGKSNFAGVSFNNERFAVQGSAWLVRCEQAKDGAMDLVFALPVDLINKEYATLEASADSDNGQIEQTEREELGEVDALVRYARKRLEQDKGFQL